MRLHHELTDFFGDKMQSGGRLLSTALLTCAVLFWAVTVLFPENCNAAGNELHSAQTGAAATLPAALEKVPSKAKQPGMATETPGKIATIIYTCNSWGYLDPCST